MKVLLFSLLTLTILTQPTYISKRDYLKENLDAVKQNLTTLLSGKEELEFSEIQLRCKELFDADEPTFYTNYSRLCFTYDQYVLYTHLRLTKEKIYDNKLKLNYEEVEEHHEEGQQVQKHYTLFLTNLDGSAEVNISYYCEANTTPDGGINLGNLPRYFQIKKDGKELSLFGEIPLFLQSMIRYSLTEDEEIFKILWDFSTEYDFHKGDGTNSGKFSEDKMTEEEIFAHMKVFAKKEGKTNELCKAIYKNYFDTSNYFFNENIVQINILPDLTKFSITVYEEEEEANQKKLYTIEYNENLAAEDPGNEVVSSINEQKQQLVGNYITDFPDENFRIFDKGQFNLGTDDDNVEPNEKQIIYQSVYQGLKNNTNTVFCRMRSRNVFVLTNRNGESRSFYSGSWNLRKKEEGCSSIGDVISEYNSERKKISEQEKGFCNKIIKEKQFDDNKFIKAVDLGGESESNQFWNFAGAQYAKIKVRDGAPFGRKLVDFILGNDFKLDDETNVPVPITEDISNKHSILLFARYYLIEENFLNNNFFAPDHYEPFMTYKSGNKMNIYNTTSNFDPNNVYFRIGPYLLANVFTNFANRADFEEKDATTGDFFLEYYLNIGKRKIVILV